MLIVRLDRVRRTIRNMVEVSAPTHGAFALTVRHVSKDETHGRPGETFLIVRPVRARRTIRNMVEASAPTHEAFTLTVWHV